MHFRLNLFLLIITALVVFFMVSCKKQNTMVNFNPAIESSQNFVMNQQMMTQVLNTYFISLNDSLLWANGTVMLDGASITIKNTPVYMMEIYYPWWGNDDDYGHFRMGVIEAIPETTFDDPGVLVDFIFTDFLFDKDSLQVQNLTVQHLEAEPGFDYKFQILVDSAIYLQDSSGRISFNMNQTFRLKKDPSSFFHTDKDILFITGTMDGITLSLNTYSAVISDSSYLKFTNDCNWLRNGPVKVETSGFTFSEVIFFPEPDTCVNQYIIELDGNPFPYPFD